MDDRQDPTAHVRIGDAERERVRAALQQHAAEGRLTLDELSDRLGEVYAARTAPELDRALRDLPPLPGEPDPQAAGPGRPGARWARDRAWAGGPLLGSGGREVTAGGRGFGPGRRGFGGRPRRGWFVPPFAFGLLFLGALVLLAAVTGFWFFPLWPLLFFAFLFSRRAGWGWGRPGGGPYAWGACGHGYGPDAPRGRGADDDEQPVTYV